MLFAIICKDKSGALQTRLDTRPEHVAFLDRLNGSGTLKFAGPFLDNDDKPCGSLIVIEADNREAAATIAAGDPYALAGVFDSVEIWPWNWTFNKPESA